MDSDCGSLIRLAFYLQTIFLTETQPDPVMYIQKSHTRSTFVYTVIFLQKLFHFIFRYSKSVISDLNIIFPAISIDINFSVSIHTFHAIINRIFKQRLHHQFYRTALQDLRIYIKPYLKNIFIAYFLDIHIVSGMFQLIFHTDDCFSPA